MTTYFDANDVRGEDYIDSRDLIDAVEYINHMESDQVTDTERELYDAIQELEAKGPTDDWHYGATFIREDCFENYAQEYAEDMGINVNEWPMNCIDWKLAAKELALDYNMVEFLGHNYYVR